MKIKDTGNRVKFNTGAEKDIAEGRGRYDLLPLETLSMLYREQDREGTAKFIDCIYTSLTVTKINDKIKSLNQALKAFIDYITEESLDTFVPVIALMFEKGAKKYAERDWEKGRPMIVYVNSILRHFFQYVNGETDEDHKAAVVWNLMTCMDTIRRLPSMAYTLNEITEPREITTKKFTKQ